MASTHIDGMSMSRYKMTSDREFNRIRWHGRVGFLATTLAVLVCLGGPVLGAQGMLQHGALFLPAIIGLIFLFGAPLIRLALATGQLNVHTPGEEALKPVQGVVRFAFVGILLLVATHAATWMFASLAGDVPERVAQMQRVEVAEWNGLWRLESSWFMPGLGLVLLTAALFWGTVRRRGLAGLSWLGSPILVFFLIVIAGGMLLVAGVPRVGALVALSVPVNWSALLDLAFWGDAGSIALVAIGAQTGVIVAAGRGLPQRAKVGRESRLLVSFIAVITVVSTLSALFLVCANSLELGLAPTIEHAAPRAILLDLVPAAAGFLVSGIPESYRPDPIMITRGWCFAVFLVSTFGMLALAISGSWLPKHKRERPALFGYAAAGVLVAVVAFTPGSDAVWSLLAVAPALLAVMRVTLARRHGMGMKLAATAFESTKGWLARLYLNLTFRVTRQLLLLMVLAVVFSDRTQGLVYGGLALAFLLMWIGSLQMRKIDSRRVTRVIPAAAVLLCLMTVIHAIDTSPPKLVDKILLYPDTYSTSQLQQDFGSGRLKLSESEIAELSKKLDELQQLAKSDDIDVEEIVRAKVASRRGLMALQASSPDDVGLLLLERRVLESDGVSPMTRVSETLIALDKGDREPAINWATAVGKNWGSNRIEVSARNDDSQKFALELTRELQANYGTWGGGTRQLRSYLVGYSVGGRSLLRPALGAGLVMILTFLAATALLVVSMLLGIRRPRSVDLEAKTD